MAEVSNHWKPAMPVYLLFSKPWKKKLKREAAEASGGLRGGPER